MIHNTIARGKRQPNFQVSTVLFLLLIGSTIVAAAASVENTGLTLSRNLQRDRGSASSMGTGREQDTPEEERIRDNHSTMGTGREKERVQIKPRSVSQASTCIPPEVVRAIHADPNDNRLPWANGQSGAVQRECYLDSDFCGPQTTAVSACCRVSFDAGWLVCDAYNAFDFMPCVCNENTQGSPTAEPTTAGPTTAMPTGRPTTAAPTVTATLSPTLTPTGAPTSSEPTGTPTEKPVIRLTANPTEIPTQEPTVAVPPTLPPTTASPTFNPTANPTANPTSDPTTNPTLAPVNPTLTPTFSTGFITENKFDADLDATIRQSQCIQDPPTLRFVQASTFTYRYEVTRLEDAASDGPLGDILLDELITDWTANFHDELAQEMMVCEGYEEDTVWIIQSKPHVVDEGASCQGSDASEDIPNNEDSNDSATCLSVVAEVRIIAYQSPTNPNSRQVWTDTSYPEGEVSQSFAQEAMAFVDERLTSGDEGLGFSPAFGITYVGGEIVVDDEAGGEVTDNNDQTADTDQSTDENENEEGTDNTSGDDNSNTDNSSTTSGDLTTGGEFWSNTAAGAQEAQNGSAPARGLSTGAMWGLAVAGACLLLILVFLVTRGRKKDREFGEDEEFLQDVTTPRSDQYGQYYSTSPVDHLDLSDSSDAGSEPTGIGVEVDIENNGIIPGNYSHKGPKQQKKSASSPKHFHFSGISGAAGSSPTSRQRNKMGPLGTADQLNDQNSDSAATGNHRGAQSTTSSGSHRGGGAVNSPSMASNPPAPYQNSSPRFYQLRDTIKL